MKAYNLSDLETQLLDANWTAVGEPYVVRQDVPGLVHDGGYTMTLTSPDGAVFQAQGPTRADAFRSTVTTAGVLEDDCPRLI